MPAVSIIIPARNAARTIRLTIESILRQTFQDFEVFVVDDGSTDDTAAVVGAIRGRVLLITTLHRGAAAARNTGAAHARGDYFFFCDADIVLAPTALEKMTNVGRRMPDLSFVYSAFTWGGRTFGTDLFDAARLKEVNYISTMSLIRRGHFKGFDESLLRFQDWDLWLTLVAEGHRGAGIPEILFSVLPRSSRLSQQGYRSRIAAIRRIRFKHHLPMMRRDYLLAIKEGLRSLLPW